jgi:putative DNA modification/repair radical SAM protein
MEKRLDVLTEGARYDLSCACGPAEPRIREGPDRWIYPAALPSGKKVFLLKILLSNACSRDCLYCVNRRSNHVRRYSLSPEELAGVFMELLRRERVTGLFLSSAIPDTASRSMERMIKAVEILRLRHRFRGYIHLKILPGAARDLVERAVALATRVSVNMECPTAGTLARVARDKDLMEQILRPIGWIRQIIDGLERRRCDQTTQFVVGAAGESDKQILARSAQLYRDARMSRIYFSAFQPPEGLLWEGMRGTPLMREHRLYQADFLLRKYGFSFEEIPLSSGGELSLDEDPKQIWAFRNPERFPLEINRAEKRELLRVPGIGPVSAERIITARLDGRLRRPDDIKGLGVVLKRALPYLLFDGRRVRQEKEALQLSLLT